MLKLINSPDESTPSNALETDVVNENEKNHVEMTVIVTRDGIGKGIGTEEVTAMMILEIEIAIDGMINPEIVEIGGTTIVEGTIRETVIGIETGDPDPTTRTRGLTTAIAIANETGPDDLMIPLGNFCLLALGLRLAMGDLDNPIRPCRFLRWN